MNHKGTAAVLASIVVLWGTLYFGFKSWEKSRQLSYAPLDLRVSKILYKTEESWGWGPGGNETGIIVYELPEISADKILSDGGYNHWSSTPLLLDGDGGGPNRTRDHEIGHYLNRYGFGIPLDPNVEQEINAALSNPGSYFSSGGVGFILIIPSSRIVVYAYNG